jgi:ubiquinone/menaquinone biosynthesis C-methylase UbiE
MVMRAVTDWDPEEYERWFKTPLGRMVDADEKAVFFSAANFNRGERVLDIGCGAGNYTVPAGQRTDMAIGLDPSEPMLRAAQRGRPGLEGIAYVQGTGETLPFPDASFDVVLIVTVLCFASNPQALLNEAHRVLRIGGRIIVGELGRYSIWAFRRRIKGILGDPIWSQARFHSPKDLQDLLKTTRFENPGVRGAVFYPPVHRAGLLRALHVLERPGRRLCPWAGAFLVVTASKR